MQSEHAKMPVPCLNFSLKDRNKCSLTVKKPLFVLLLLLQLPVLAKLNAADPWRHESPENHGFSAAKLDAFREGLAARNTKALLVVRNDTIVCEWYAPGQDAKTRFGTASLAKALVGGVSLAVAMSDGRIGLDDPAARFIPQWRDDPRKSRITLRQLGSHTSGVEDAEADNKPHDQLTGWKGDFWKHLAVPNDPFSISRDRAPLVFEPGSEMRYSNPGIALLTYCVTASLRGAPEKDIRSLLRERVLRPIGVPDAEWSAGYGKTSMVDGLPLVGSWGGATFTTRAAARVGRLMLRGGDWDGRRILSTESVRLTTADAGTPGPCGMGWWSNNEGDCAKLPRDAFFGSGAGHQILLVIPSLNVLVARFGAVLAETDHTPKAYHEPYRLYLFEPLMEAITDAPIAPAARQTSAQIKFQHFTIADPLPGKAWGTAGIPLADLDGDGDLDCALSRRDAHGFWWYERRTDSVWIQHLICDSTQIEQGLGAAALDIDNDGWTDLVFSHAWFKNPGTLQQNPDAAWPVNPFPGSGHDILAADLNGDGRKDIVVFDGEDLAWFDPARGMARHEVALKLGHHGGLTPHGVGDLDGDGDPDLVVAGAWFENPGKGAGSWTRHSWPHLVITNASYGISIRSWVADIDRDGQNDIVYSDCDTGSSHVYWVRNEGQGARWTHFALPDPPTSPGNVPGTGSFHSLGVADFNLDGHLDIFAGEQEDPDAFPHWAAQGKLPMKAKGLKERGVIWVNSGSRPPLFTPRVIQEDNPGWHDACPGDVDGDGDMDIVSKVWNKDGPSYHADYWRNEAVKAGAQ